MNQFHSIYLYITVLNKSTNNLYYVSTPISYIVLFTSYNFLLSDDLIRYSTEAEETESELAVIPESKSDSTAQGSSQVT